MMKRRHLTSFLFLTVISLLIIKGINISPYLSCSEDIPLGRYGNGYSNIKAPGSCHKQLSSTEHWSPPTLPPFLVNASQENPALVQHICKEWILSPFTEARNLSQPHRKYFSQRSQSTFIDELLEKRTDGFFIESGAADGEALSNSLFFEISRNWTGLLVEANPNLFRSVLSKRRHAYMVNACLSPTTKAISLPFLTANYLGGVPKYMERTHMSRIKDEYHHVNMTKVQCFPLYSILKALRVTHVDYFSLDIEGAELEVLYTLPLNEITVDVFSIEYQVSNNRAASKAKLAAIKRYLVSVHGYQIIHIDKYEDVILKKY